MTEFSGNAPGWMCVTSSQFKAGPVSAGGDAASCEPREKRPEKPIDLQARQASMARAREILSRKRLTWPEGYYSLAEAAAKWGWSYNALAAAISRDTLKAVKAGKWWIVNDEIMQAYEQRCIKAGHGRKAPL